MRLGQSDYFLKILTGEKSPSNKIPALRKYMNTDTWVVGTSKQLFISDFLKLKVIFLKI